jgi:hypothetical protein
MAANGELWDEYRATWKAFARQLDELQRRVETGERDRIESALLGVERARLAHNESRDRLAAHLAGEMVAADRRVSAGGLPDEARVRKTARLLWEFSGKPHGTAENDWFRAERLVRSAVAARE